MTNLPSDRAYIQSEETDTESPVSEQTLQKIGSAINFLNDRYQLSITEFLSSGTFTPPEGVDTVLLIGCGGGGGGVNTSAANNFRGSNGATLYTKAVSVTPLTNYSVTIGGGGAGGLNAGSNGGATSFAGLASFEGGSGGQSVPSGDEGVVAALAGGIASTFSTYRSSRGSLGCINGFSLKCAPRANCGFFSEPSNSSDNTNLLRGGNGPFGIGGAGATVNNAPANSGAGGGNDTDPGSGLSGGDGGSGRLLVVF